jgi:hypothetical protein
VKRQCGECTLCCKLLPIPTIGKAAGVACEHQCSKGCRIYDARPHDCRRWSCLWLMGGAGKIGRPDHSHVVVDMQMDHITVGQNEKADEGIIDVVQIWVHPRHRDAWRAPPVLEYLDKLGTRNVAAIIRYSPYDAVCVFPPSMTGGGWTVKTGNIVPEEQHHAQLFEIMTKLEEQGK